MTMKRITREIADLKKEDLGPIVLEPSEGNLNMWKGSIPGPQGSVYEGGIFNVEIVLPADYPFSAPRVLFKTRIYHMNISEQGNICIDILKQNWSPALSLFKVMLSLSSLLTDPNPRDPLVPSIATQYTRHRKEHDATARQWTANFATPKPPPPPVVVKPPPSPKPSKAKGKRRADPGPSNASGSSSSAPRSTRSAAAVDTSVSEVIELDSEDEIADAAEALSANARGKKRKRPQASAAVEEEEVVDLVDSDDEKPAVTKKSRTRKPPSGAGRGSGASSSRRSARQLGDVIVIDDDDI
ncbi:hypothetical protein GALMADRAFT_254941 [Galerina marginata CBS 339.88]|uniref:E2 ubiquitin-conjugating enzyme n=1 Tax=Galerina marginata (strain CBS 339.88) TaxID=685588 RepID=A0A067SGP4_GALM3|nr:hypothetical protein GALMADRAFT_254941 [Galerina marginata CBS 339.88]